MDTEKRPKAKLISFRYLVYDFVKITAALPALLVLRPRWYYESPAAKKRIRGGAVVISNHYGFFDPMYLMLAIWYRRHHFVCGKEFFESRARWWFKSFLCIPVDRQNFSMNTLRAISDELKQGSLVSLFPEGHINGREENVGAFKSGMVLMALQGKAPIVPVYVQPKKHFYSRSRFVIGEAVDITGIYGPRPTFTQIGEVAGLLKEREDGLRAILEKPKGGRR